MNDQIQEEFKLGFAAPYKKVRGNKEIEGRKKLPILANVFHNCRR